jgi:predicted RNA-binding Zn-ribbon protein involved in translation (DUF1610 family)
MTALAPPYGLSWTFWILAALIWVGAAVHSAASMRRTGRSFWLWLVIGVFLSVVPAAAVSTMDYVKARRAHHERAAAGPARCPHCGEMLTARNVRHVGGNRICAGCGLTIDGEDRIA